MFKMRKCYGEGEKKKNIYIPLPVLFEEFFSFSRYVSGIFSCGEGLGERGCYDASMPIRRFGRGRGSGKEADVLDEQGDTVRWATSMREMAKELRQQQTPAEEILWQALRRKQLSGLKFYRQVAIDRFVVDFYCPSKLLIIELDGDIHEEKNQKDHDLLRDVFLHEKGLHVLRFTNDEVVQGLKDVLRKIQEKC
jgi:very-short-patch-repair endonuclease